MLTSASTESFVVDESELGIGNLLVQTGKLTSRDLERAIAAGDELRGRLSDVLVQLGLVSEIDVTQARSVLLGLPFVSADDFPETSPDVPGLQTAFLRSHRVLPVALEPDRLDVVMADPQDRFVLKALHLATGLAIRPFLAMGSDIDKALAQRDVEGGVEESELEEDIDSGDFVEHLKDLASEAPVIRLVNTIVGRVIELRASDIHLEPFENGLQVRYRVDGVLQSSDLLPVKQGAAVVSRIKLLAHIDIAERRLPQDGRIRTRVKGRELDLRISTVPTVHGESVVMRVLDPAGLPLAARATPRHFPGDRSDRRRQDDDPVCRARGTGLGGAEDHHRGRSGGVPVRRHRADAGASPDRPDVRFGTAVHPAAGPRHHHDRRNARWRNRADCRPGRFDRPPRTVHAAHEHRGQCRDPDA
jgi:hypothetical protein